MHRTSPFEATIPAPAGDALLYQRVIYQPSQEAWNALALWRIGGAQIRIISLIIPQAMITPIVFSVFTEHGWTELHHHTPEQLEGLNRSLTNENVAALFEDAVTTELPYIFAIITGKPVRGE